jgi:hypothetical protein
MGRSANMRKGTLRKNDDENRKMSRWKDDYASFFINTY